MRLIAFGLALLCGCTVQPPAGPSAAIAEIEGRVAGAPRRCVSIERHQALRVANPGTLVYGSGRTIYINRLGGSCGVLHYSDVLVTEPLGTEYCSGDLVRSMNASSRIPGPTCRLGEFIPYQRP